MLIFLKNSYKCGIMKANQKNREVIMWINALNASWANIVVDIIAGIAILIFCDYRGEERIYRLFLLARDDDFGNRVGVLAHEIGDAVDGRFVRFGGRDH